jgi:hypothetical protein
VSYRDELVAAGYTLPPAGDPSERWSTDTAYAFQQPNGMVVVFNKSMETFWRNRDVSNLGAFPAATKRELHVRKPGEE